ncbi:MAG: hypothetical protein ED559_06755 [Phycisphaera sp.]|nr:MAG: hypothetical protein ED559_06755 [Phycisphaera sp.]
MKSMMMCSLALLPASVAAQTFLDIEVCYVGFDRIEAYAKLVNPEGEVLAAVADLGFRLEGWDLRNFEYNPAFDSDFFGDATVTASSTSIDFLGGNTLPPLNNTDGPDSSNPLFLFSVEGNLTGFELVGQVTGAYAPAGGSPFPTILTYQDANGNQGDTPYDIDFCFPSPGSASLLAFAGIAAVRRRR